MGLPSGPFGLKYSDCGLSPAPQFVSRPSPCVSYLQVSMQTDQQMQDLHHLVFPSQAHPKTRVLRQMRPPPYRQTRPPLRDPSVPQAHHQNSGFHTGQPEPPGTISAHCLQKREQYIWNTPRIHRGPKHHKIPLSKCVRLLSCRRTSKITRSPPACKFLCQLIRDAADCCFRCIRSTEIHCPYVLCHTQSSRNRPVSCTDCKTWLISSLISISRLL